MALRTLADDVGAIILEIQRETGSAPADYAISASSNGLVAGHDHLEAMGTLFYEGMRHKHSIVALARAAVESFGRAWRILQGEDQEQRNALAKELREHEQARAIKNGIRAQTRQGGPVDDDVVAGLKVRRHLDSYTDTAVGVLEASGATPALALQHYSLMSAVAHGEALGIEAITTEDEFGPRFELPRDLASSIARDVLGAARAAILRYVALYSPDHEERTVKAFDEAVHKLYVATAIAGSDYVYLVHGVNAAVGEFITRAELPTTAEKTIYMARGEDVDGDFGEMYEVWDADPSETDPT